MLRSERDFSGIFLLEWLVLKFDETDAAKDADHHFPTDAWILLFYRRFCTKRKDAVKSFPKGWVSSQQSDSSNQVRLRRDFR